MITTDIAVITSVFNPVGFKQPRQNFDRFIARLEQDGVPWYAIELAFHDDPWWLPKAANIVHCRSKSVLWHKENLLNVLAGKLPPEMKKIVWADNDLLFSTPDWWKKASEMLEEKILIQPYEEAVWREADGVGICRRKQSFGRYYLRKAPARDGRVNWRECHPGFAWAARREFFERGGLDIRNVLGGADLSMALAFAGMKPTGGWNEKVTRFQQAYAESMSWINGRLGYLPGVTVDHLWHGHLRHRQRNRRRTIAEKFEYDPLVDISHDANGMLQWATPKAEFHKAVYKYFQRRREDPFTWRNFWQSCVNRLGLAGRPGPAASAYEVSVSRD
jgi:hypothetical protein